MVAQTESPYLLISLAHQGPMPRLLANVLNHILNHFVVLLIVNFESETFTLLQYSPSQECCYFPNTSCKDQCINLAIQFDVIATNKAEDAVDEDSESQPTSGIR